MMAALEEAYANQKMVGKFPGCVLHLTTRLNAVDVNVHPTKQEVKFGSDKKVFDAVYYAVKSTLEADRTWPSLQVKPPAPGGGGAACAVSPLPGGAHSGGPRLPGDDPGGVPPDGGTARSAPAPPRLHRPPATGAAPAAPAGNGVSGAPHLHPPVRRGGHPYPPGRSRTCPRRERHLRPPTSAAPHARTDGRARPAESAPASGAPISTVRPVGADAHIRPAEAAPDQPVGAAFGRPTSRRALSAPFGGGGALAHGGGGAQHLHHRGAGRQGALHRQARRPRAAELRPDEGRGLPAHGAGPAGAGGVHPSGGGGGPPCWPSSPLLGRFGFEAEDFGGGALIVRAAPSDVAAGEIPDVLSELANRLLTGGSADPGAARDALLTTPWPARRPSRAARGTAPPSYSRWPRRSCPARSNIAPRAAGGH